MTLVKAGNVLVGC